MSDYWKKKMDELERETKARYGSSYWDKKMAELENEKRIPVTTRSKKKDDDEDDIAPVRTTKKDDDDGIDFFQRASVFDDGKGTVAGDVLKTILGSVGDAGLNAVKGVGGLVEGVGDFVGYGIAQVADWTGNNDYADIVRKSAQENTLDKMLKPAEDYLDKYSVLGRTSDAILQGVGQVGGIMLTGGIGSAANLGSAGVTALTTGLMGLSGTGSGIGEAYRGGANDLQAWKHGLNSGAADAVSELIFGGLGKAINALGFSRGLSSADDMLAKLVTSKFKNQAAKNIVEFGIKAGAEGLEEVIAGFAQGYSKYHNYLKDQGMDLGDVLKDENLLEQFIVGSFTSGLAQAPGVHIANRTGTDFITGMTQNEQAVFDKEVENRIAEEEKDGKKLTAKEKAKIEEQVQKDLEKGYISTDLIEEVVGGETYKAYKDSVDREDALFREYEELGNTQNPTLAQQYRYSELDSRVKSIKDNDLRSQRKAHLDQYVAEQVKGTRLAESYMEIARTGEDFKADISKYKGAKHLDAVKKTLENASQMGLNNTNRVHDFVDLYAKISADTGKVVKFKSGEQIKNEFIELHTKQINEIEKIPEDQRTAEQLKMLEIKKKLIADVQSGDVTVNGDILGDEIVVNLDSKTPLNRTVGHEVTHSVEKAKSYDALKKSIFAYAADKGVDIEAEIARRKLTYEGIANADPEAELVADLVGDYLFSDGEYVNRLSVENRNLFQRIYDEIKHLLKLATAGSKEARELEKVKRAFEKAYREGGNAQTDTRYSITEPNRNVGRRVGDLRKDAVSIIEWYGDFGFDTAKEALSHFHSNPKEFIDSFEFDNDTDKQVLVDYANALEEQQATPDTTSKENVSDSYVERGASTQNSALPERIRNVNAELGRTMTSLNNASQYINGVQKLRQQLDNREITSEQFVVELKKNPRYKELDDKANALREQFDSLVEELETVTGKKWKELRFETLYPSKTKFSLSDSNGKQLSQEQQDYFKDSVVRDENGNLKVMYHGTSSGGFTVFDTYGSNYGLFGTGSYFTDSKNIGESYTKKGKGKNPQVYEAYLNIKNPMDMDAAADPAEWAKAFPDADFPESGTNEQFYRAVEEFYEDQWMSKWEVAEEIQAAIESGMGYDGITHIGGGRVNPNGERHRVYIAFQPEQIKSVDNQKPTEDPDIRYSLSDKDYLDAVNRGDTQTAQKMVDEAARAAGYNYRGVHRAKTDFTVFDKGKIGSGAGLQFGDGFYVSLEIKDKATADYADSAYGKVKMDLYVKMQSPLELGKPISEETVARLAEDLIWFGDDDSVKYGVAPEVVHEQLTSGDSHEQMEAIRWISEKNVIKISELLKKSGFDGIISANEYVTQAVVWDENQLKSADSVTYDRNGNTIPLSERFKAENNDIRYSLSEDSDGNRLTEEQAEYFKKSKMRDADGNLKVMYHGSKDGGFHVFDPGYSDDNTSFFFVDSNDVAMSYSGTSETYAPKNFRTAEDFNKFFAEIGAEEYEVREKDGKFNLYEDGDLAAVSGTAEGIYEEFRDWSGLGYGDVNYKVYLNLENPLVVDAHGNEWNDLAPIGDNNSTFEYIKVVDYNYNVFTEEEAITIEYLERGSKTPVTEEFDPDNFPEDVSEAVWTAIQNGEEIIKNVGSNYRWKTRDYAQYAKDNGYDGVIFNDIDDIGGYGGTSEIATVAIAFDSNQIKSVANESPTPDADIRYSLSRNEELMTNAENKNPLQVDLTTARQQRQAIYEFMTANADRLKLPEDIEDDTAIKNSSYDISEENTTVCIRSMAADALCDAVAENLGRPLTVQDTLRISQDLMNYTDEPECVYCYVATDRRAYREFLGSYYQQMQNAIESIQSGKSGEEVYQAFLNGRKDTKNMRSRFAMWQNIAAGGKMISAMDLASEKMMQNAMRDPELAPQVKDARAYAQSASWAKKRNGYQAYNGHILRWSQRRINGLNKHYGLRFYSFSDFSPAFVLENMQQITDAAVRGLKGLAYTKVLDFAEIFAPTGININISVFGYDQNGVVAQDGMMGADWNGAQELRNKYENVGITFVATNDSQIDWALNQDWIDVVIPYHLVRTGQAVAKHFGYTNYTAESGDTKGENWKKGNKKTIYPSEHNNDKATYLAALANENLKPRFERWVTHPNYMKLVNETRRSAKDTPPMQAVFNEDAAIASLERMAQRGGYFVPIGGDYENMHEIAGEIADDIRSKNSLSAEGESSGFAPLTRFDVFGNELLKQTAPAQEDIAPVADTAPAATVAENAPVAEDSSVVEDLFPDDPTAPLPEQDYEQLASLSDADAPPEMEAPYREDIEPEKVEDPFYDRDIDKVGNRKVKAYMYENPEVKPFFQEEAAAMLGELNSTIKGERFYSDEAFREGGYEAAWTGVSRFTSDDIAYLLDECHMTYADIEKGLNAIIEDHGAENIAAAKKIEFILNDRLLNGFTDFTTGMQIPPDQGYINLLAEKQITEYSKEAFATLDDRYAPAVDEDIAPVAAPAVSDRAYEAIRPQPPKKVAPAPADDDIGPVVYGDKLVRVDSNNGRPGEKQRKWVGTSTESEVVNRQVLPDDLDQDKIHYQPISNKVTLGKANAKLDGMGYESSVNYFNSQFTNKSVSLEDVALGERLIQEAIKRGDTKTAGELIQNVAILGTELGQKVQALSMIQRMTPEGQLKMLQKTVERGKAKGDKAYDDVVITQEMIDKILEAYKPDGSYDQMYLDGVVEDVKKQIADQMKVTALDKVNAWRYLSMLGNPKTHIRNLVSNVAMRGTVAVKNALARTIESVAPIENRTKTWEKPTEYINSYAQKAAAEMKDIISDGGKYSEDSSIKQKRDIFKNKILNGLYEFNSDMLTKEDWWFSKTAFTNALSEYLTANGIRTSEDIRNNPKLVEKARVYATEQSQIATFRQYSWLANKINDIERHNAVADIAVGAIMPFKKTPINIAKTGLNYSPLGFAKTLTYDISQVKKGNMEASEMIDHLSQNITGSALTLIGYMLASSGLLSGAGDDDKEGEYDYQLGQQAYAVNIGGKSYSLSWLSPIAMPLLVGANAYEQLVEGKEWNGDVVVETLAQTLDPLSEMSFLSGLDSVLSSYDSGLQKFAGIGETMVQNYATQFVPTLSSQVATVLDDTKRSTKVGSDSDFKFVDQTINKLKYKIPFLRETLEPSTDIWGNNIKQTENVLTRAFETFLAPYAVKKNTATAVDEEIKALFRETGEDSVIPGIPSNTVTYKDQKYKMSEKEFTAYKQTYGQTSFGLLEELFRTDTYRNADAGEKADMVGKVYDYARDLAKQEFLAKKSVQYTNATSDGDAVYKEDAIRGAIEADMPVDEYTFSVKYPEKHAFLNQMGISYDTYVNADEDTKKAYSWALENPDKYPMSKAVASDVVEYRRYASELYDIKADKDADGKSISGSRKEKVLDYINGLDIDYGAKLILFKSEYNSDDESNYEIIEYLNGRSDISFEEEVAILRELGFTVTDDGDIYWD